MLATNRAGPNQHAQSSTRWLQPQRHLQERSLPTRVFVGGVEAMRKPLQLFPYLQGCLQCLRCP